MAFEFHTPSVDVVEKIATSTMNGSLKERILVKRSRNFVWLADPERDAYLFTISATCRDTSMQGHFAFFYLGGVFEIRNKNWYSNEVCFYDFPSDFVQQRVQIEKCFCEAAPIYGYFGDCSTQEENALFIPVFGPDNWIPRGM